jgi:hypothetical protein
MTDLRERITEQVKRLPEHDLHRLWDYLQYLTWRKAIPDRERPDAEPSQQTEGWAVLRSLGDNAPGGQLRDAAAEHDRYLYKKHES